MSMHISPSRERYTETQRRIERQKARGRAYYEIHNEEPILEAQRQRWLSKGYLLEELYRDYSGKVTHLRVVD